MYEENCWNCRFDIIEKVTAEMALDNVPFDMHLCNFDGKTDKEDDAVDEWINKYVPGREDSMPDKETAEPCPGCELTKGKK